LGVCHPPILLAFSNSAINLKTAFTHATTQRDSNTYAGQAGTNKESLLPQDYLDSELKILSNPEVILKLKKDFDSRSCPTYCSQIVTLQVARDFAINS
jgi:hypothetical protein